MGGLTNKPAFQDNRPLWSHTTHNSHPAPNSHNQNITMPESTITAADPTPIAAAQHELTDLRAKLAEADKAIAAQRSKEALTAVQAAVKRGAIAAANTDLQTKWQRWLETNPDLITALQEIPDHPAVSDTRLTDGRPAISASEGAINTVRAYAAVQSKQAKINGIDPVACAQRGTLARESAAIYKSIIKNWDDFGHMPLASISAATTTDTDLGSLAGDLIAQRTLELLKYQFPVLSRITSDFSDQPASYGQTIMTRFMTVPNVATYSPTTGWTTPASTPTATDAPVVINAHKGVPIRFQENQLAGTMRRLFDEFAPAASYALAKDMVDALYALITAATYTNTSIKADKSAFGRAEVIDMGVALQKKGVPIGAQNRTLLLNSDYFGQLAKDTAIVTLAAFQRPAIIEQGVLPDVHGFAVVDSPNLPPTGNLVGFGFSKSALLIAARLPNDYSAILPGSSYGSVTTITDPDLGLSVMQVQYVDHKLGFAESRMALMYGVAAGQVVAGQRLVSS